MRRYQTRFHFVALFIFMLTSALAQDHWSFRPITRPPPPRANGTHTASAIDAFIVRKLEDAGLTLSPEADRHTLIRRLFIVMLGVPPAIGTVDAFVRDEAPLDDAWPRLVDRVLGDLRYGEHWAQHWLDVIRWAETVGFETNAPRANAWPYRDWVIDAFNEDKPYDQFIFQQLAGDTCEEDAALGFLVAGPANLPDQVGRDEQAMREARQDELDEVIRTVSQGFFGLTIGCARCHDHKFDPITAKDYYAMQAIFAGLRYGERRWRGRENDVWTAKVPHLEERLERLERELENQRIEHGLRLPLANVQEETFAPVLAKSVRMMIAATADGQPASLYEFEVWQDQDGRETNAALASSGGIASASSFALENQTRHPDCLNDGSVDKRQAFPWRADGSGPAWIQIDLAQPTVFNRVVWHQGFSTPADYVIQVKVSEDDAWQEVAHTRDRLPSQDDTRPPTEVKLQGLTEVEVASLTSLNARIREVRTDLAKYRAGPQVYAAGFSSTPPDTWLLKRGDAMQRAEIVEPAAPAILGDLGLASQAAESERRRALARHLTQDDQPLAARVIVNRIWQRHFATGLVATPSDFGKMGSPPSHPELLDWLASDLMDHGWSLKRLHRQILTSRTFRQSSRPHSDALARDAAARLLWRFPPRRVQAEVIRDSMLSVSGTLNPQRGGVGFDFFVQQGGLSDYQAHETFPDDGRRRMIYARKIRMQAVPIFGNFDCPDAGQMTPQRTRSITPMQSLGLMNSPFAMRQAGFFAKRLQTEAGPDIGAQVKHAIALAFSREATEEEVERLAALARSHGLEQVCRVLFNTSEFIFLP